LEHCQIAAIARANGMTLATNNVAEFRRVSGLLGYEGYVRANKFVAILQARVRKLLSDFEA